LHNLHRAHLLAIPFENIDVQIRHRRPFTMEAAYEKIVKERRGGWCYEMNGLFALILRELGFRFDLVAGAVGRDKYGDASLMNHLAILVHLERTYLADVGFAGTLTPLPLCAGQHNDGRMNFALSQHGDWWRFHSPDGISFDFTTAPRQFKDFEHKARLLATTAESFFVQNLIVAQLTEEGQRTLTNARFKAQSATEILEETAPTADELGRILDEEFGLQIEPIAPLWQRVAAQHKTATRKKLRGF
jgi:N-hydroxyarylamine O-acetyltransferase